jgi:hypothetical protein
LAKTGYASLAAFRQATGQETQGLQADPGWAAPGAGNFHLSAGSPAIDSADSAVSGEQTTDVEGNGRIDDPGTPNTGAGARSYDDRGAYEFQPDPSDPSDDPPTAVLSVTPATGTTPVEVTADASGSSDTDATPIATYRFDFGDGTTVGPQAGDKASHTYTQGGTFTVTVTDTAGLSSTATSQVTIKQNLVGNSGFETDTTGWNTSGSGTGVTLTRVSGGHSGGWAAKLTNAGTAAATCLLNDSPNWVAVTSSGSYTGSIWVRVDSAGAGAVLNLRFREYSGTTLVGTRSTQVTLTTSWQLVTVTYTPVSPNSSNLDFNAYLTAASAPQGSYFYADDAVIVGS